MNANGNQTLSDEKRSSMIADLTVNFFEMLKIMDFNINDPQIMDTPERMAKMYVNELLAGCYTPAPKMTKFPGKKELKQNLVFLGPIEVKSLCSHHFLPFIGNAYIAYQPGSTVVGISKLSRAVHWFMRRPQIQEDFTYQLCEFLQKELGTEMIIVHVEASHLCMTIRGVNEPLGSTMTTTAYKGFGFQDFKAREEFFSQIARSKK